MARDDVTSSNSAALARLFWMAVGPMILSLLTVIIVSRTSRWLSLSSVAFLVVLGGMIFARWWEFQGNNPKTSTGDPAMPADLHRYVLFTALVGLCLWVVANLFRSYSIAS